MKTSCVRPSRSVARKLVVYHRRLGEQSQFSELLDLAPRSDRIQRALTYARRNLQTELSVTALAKVASLSPRQFSRAFLAEIGQPPQAIRRSGRSDPIDIAASVV
ncbi:transcriptional regulator GlxA family with amidase domain [Rhizobium leucaenae]|uniref:Transcriptional regulator GlxA family with amidase domain n=1 Tax=Rhizobium leucaenae TaxID=29450 RepID=A0A7W7EMK3_9HYPH|nr:transcriptional regulator GlxA family with amidase domain [Rhizobium leucaenae]MBB6302826.1 transcriptional regulator GlxA family with amidase domain [Rhizobium leucaenae]